MVQPDLDFRACFRFFSLSDGTDYSGHVLVGGRPVCDDNWEDVDARVACTAMGFQPITTRAFAHSGGKFGSGHVIGQFRMDEVHCLGTERHLRYCKEYLMSNNCKRFVLVSRVMW